MVGRQIICWILALIIALAFIMQFAALSNRTEQLQARIDELQVQHEELKSEVSEIKKQYITQDALEPVLQDVEAYCDKVERLMLNYKDLDEILKQMFGEAQARYMKRQRKRSE